MKDLETIFREHRIACDGVVNCPIDDWNAIVSQVSEMEAMLEIAISLIDDDSIEDFVYQYREIKALLAKARGETK